MLDVYYRLLVNGKHSRFGFQSGIDFPLHGACSQGNIKRCDPVDPMILSLARFEHVPEAIPFER
ncbi:MAG: hypothetical protein IPM67_03200 [Sphingomonadales bacterium]|nr:hypothetical protein [Sphingomonadales bacterium]